MRLDFSIAQKGLHGERKRFRIGTFLQIGVRNNVATKDIEMSEPTFRRRENRHFFAHLNSDARPSGVSLRMQLSRRLQSTESKSTLLRHTPRGMERENKGRVEQSPAMLVSKRSEPILDSLIVASVFQGFKSFQAAVAKVQSTRRRSIERAMTSPVGKEFCFRSQSRPRLYQFPCTETHPKV